MSQYAVNCLQFCLQLTFHWKRNGLMLNLGTSGALQSDEAIHIRVLSEVFGCLTAHEIYKVNGSESSLAFDYPGLHEYCIRLLEILLMFSVPSPVLSREGNNGRPTWVFIKSHLSSAFLRKHASPLQVFFHRQRCSVGRMPSLQFIKSFSHSHSSPLRVS